jgi:aminoglycoside phosphotransferase (APT) family kinase protein
MGVVDHGRSSSGVVAAACEAVGYPTSDVQVVLEERGRLVARVAADGRPPLAVKAVEGEHSLDDEIAALRLMHDGGVPVSPIRGELHTHGAHLLVTDWYDGVPLSSSAPTEVQAQAGEVLRRVSHLPTDRGVGSPVPLPFVGHLTGWVHGDREWLIAERASLDPDVGCRWLELLGDVLESGPRQMTLTDGRRDHFLVSGNRLAGVIDVAAARVHDPAMDLAVLAVTDPNLLPGVVRGWGPTADEASYLRAVIPFYVWLRRVSAARWKVEVAGNTAPDAHLLALASTQRAGDQLSETWALTER